MVKRKIIREKLESFSPYEMEGSLKQHLAEVQSTLMEYEKKGYSDISLSYDRREDPAYSDSVEYVLYGFREETDKEREKRLAKEKKELEKKAE
jgi:hypothetical protein